MGGPAISLPSAKPQTSNTARATLRQCSAPHRVSWFRAHETSNLFVIALARCVHRGAGAWCCWRWSPSGDTRRMSKAGQTTGGRNWVSLLANLETDLVNDCRGRDGIRPWACFPATAGWRQRPIGVVARHAVPAMRVSSQLRSGTCLARKAARVLGPAGGPPRRSASGPQPLALAGMPNGSKQDPQQCRGVPTALAMAPSGHDFGCRRCRAKARVCRGRVGFMVAVSSISSRDPKLRFESEAWCHTANVKRAAGRSSRRRLPVTHGGTPLRCSPARWRLSKDRVANVSAGPGGPRAIRSEDDVDLPRGLGSGEIGRNRGARNGTTSACCGRRLQRRPA